LTRAAFSVIAFAVYLVVLGLVLVFAPNVLLAIFGLPPVTDVWLRVVGMLVLVLAYYYARAARLGLIAFFPLTVHVRGVVILVFAGFVAGGLVAPVLLLFGVADLAGAIWTWRALVLDARGGGAAAAAPV